MSANGSSSLTEDLKNQLEAAGREFAFFVDSINDDLAGAISDAMRKYRDAYDISDLSVRKQKWIEIEAKFLMSTVEYNIQQDKFILSEYQRQNDTTNVDRMLQKISMQEKMLSHNVDLHDNSKWLAQVKSWGGSASKWLGGPLGYTLDAAEISSQASQGDWDGVAESLTKLVVSTAAVILATTVILPVIAAGVAAGLSAIGVSSATIAIVTVVVGAVVVGISSYAGSVFWSNYPATLI